jgi:hypothetical protein
VRPLLFLRAEWKPTAAEPGFAGGSLDFARRRVTVKEGANGGTMGSNILKCFYQYDAGNRTRGPPLVRPLLLFE